MAKNGDRPVMKIRASATRRLISAHADEFQTLMADEAQKAGFVVRTEMRPVTTIEAA